MLWSFRLFCLIISLCLPAILVNPAPAHAETIRFQAVSGDLNGWFDFDTGTSLYSNVNLWTLPACSDPVICDATGARWNNLSSQGAYTVSGFRRQLVLGWNAPIAGARAGDWFIASGFHNYNGSDERHLTGRFMTRVAAVPVPAALPLLAGGLLILGGAGLRHKRKKLQ